MAMTLRCSFASSLGAESKKDVSRRDVKAKKKSGGVTSETNHGISLGLVGTKNMNRYGCFPGRRCSLVCNLLKNDL